MFQPYSYQLPGDPSRHPPALPPLTGPVAAGLWLQLDRAQGGQAWGARSGAGVMEGHLVPDPYMQQSVNSKLSSITAMSSSPVMIQKKSCRKSSKKKVVRDITSITFISAI